MSQESSEALTGHMERAHITTSSEESLDFTKLGQIIYRPLHSNLKEVRILQVAPGINDDIVSCTLKNVSLLDDPKPEYETISYCWGPPRDLVSIMLDGRMVTVPPSSEAAVRRMRLSDKPRVLWIDAICIDQSSKSERSEQVAFMGMIYSSGERNLIYLGEDDEGMASRALKSIQDLVNEMRVITNDFETLTSTLWDVDTGEEMFSDEDFVTELDFVALQFLYDLPWFR
jgi:hypothetical protein